MATAGSAACLICQIFTLDALPVAPPEEISFYLPWMIIQFFICFFLSLFFLFLLQVAAVIGIGLVYQGTGHRHNAEVLLSEIGV